MGFNDSNIAMALKKLTFIYLPYKKWRIESGMKKRIKAVHTIGYRELAAICNEFEKESIPLFCAFGTLLGIVRDQDFIKNDSDIDIGIVDSGSGQWNLIEKTMQRLGYRKDHQYAVKNKIIEQTYHKGYLSVDFFLYESEGSRLVAAVPFRDENIQYNSEKEHSVMKRYSPQIQSITSVSFKGFNVSIPENAKEYLSMVYGPKWEIPDPNYRYEKEANVADYVCYEERQ